ncbi:unnamed protein product [Notodromas monacha]|uniref:FAD-dependent oxidoreductase domain-containing protein 1 n=1 Tax=Notodromas monacha TaxID=399045 RepID=A0A7R9GBG5_9CRUS|nr:unnamed protein product [Notodromas monacha]CAG0916337.1 unnamed protein product [Notodromas monacha]
MTKSFLCLLVNSSNSMCVYSPEVKPYKKSSSHSLCSKHARKGEKRRINCGSRLETVNSGHYCGKGVLITTEDGICEHFPSGSSYGEEVERDKRNGFDVQYDVSSFAEFGLKNVICDGKPLGTKYHPQISDVCHEIMAVARVFSRISSSTSRCWRHFGSKSGDSNSGNGSSTIDKEGKPRMRALKEMLNEKGEVVDSQLRAQKDFFSAPLKRDPNFPHYVDVVIIGGGAIGTATAFHIKQIHSKVNVLVVEKDPTYAKASTTLSVGGIRQQFSVPENIMMSQYGYDFIRNFQRNCSCEDVQPPDINFNPHGYVFAATEAGADTLRENYILQKDYGVKSTLLGPDDLQQRFPWMNVEGLALASVGTQGEGWFDPWALLYGMKAKASFLGTRYLEAEAIGFEFEELDNYLLSETVTVNFNRATSLLVKVRTPEGEQVKPIRAPYYILATGAHSADLAFAAQIGTGKGMLRHKLPIEPRKRYVYTIHAPDGPGLDCPFFIDPSGMYFRREGLGGVYLTGMSPAPEHEPDASNLDSVDFSYFDEQIWPLLAHRVPGFEKLKVRSGWAGYYDYNIMDQNPIIGPHPYHPNIIFASGFSGHGIQHSPAAGRGVAELVFHGEYRSINLGRFSYDRVMLNKPLQEVNVV